MYTLGGILQSLEKLQSSILQSLENLLSPPPRGYVKPQTPLNQTQNPGTCANLIFS